MNNKKCPLSAAGCAECTMYEGENCIVKDALRSLPAIAEELNKLGWLERIADEIEGISTTGSFEV